MKAFDSTNDWLKFWNDNQKSLFRAWAQGKPPAFAVEGMPPPDANAVADLMRRTMEQWAGLSRYDAASIRKLFDPAEWKRAASHFDMGLEKLAEGPTYATLWDLDRKMLKLQQLWVEHARDVERYWEIVQGAWTRALQRFAKSLGTDSGEPITSGRQLLDLWLATANRELVEMHRSEAFLEAQRNLTRSSAEYRLAERGIAEAFCEAHHIPTRTEMDEVQRTVVELRRELRALKKASGAPASAGATPSRRRPGPSTRKKR